MVNRTFPFTSKLAKRSLVVVAAGEQLEADVYCCVVSMLIPTLGLLLRRGRGVNAVMPSKPFVPDDCRFTQIYTVLQGLSHCFKKKDDGRLADVMVIEPIGSSSLECMAAGKQQQHPPLIQQTTSFAVSDNMGPAECAACV